jgi:integrase
MPPVKMSASWVQAVQAPPKGQLDYRDTHPAGLILRVSATGVKSWCILYRYRGRQQRYTFGQYPVMGLAEARQYAVHARHTLMLGQDPRATVQQAAAMPLVADVATWYLDRWAKPHKKSWRDDARLLAREVVPVWGSWPLDAVTRAHVVMLLERIVQRGSPVQANRVLALVRKLFNWAISAEILAHNPCLRLPLPTKERPRELVLAPQQILTFWQVSGQAPPRMGAYFRLLLLTAQRSGEVRGMRWSELAEDWWTIPGTATKNGQAHRVPLGALAVQTLAALPPPPAGVPWVLWSPRRPGHHLIGTRKAFLRMLAGSGLPCTPHDLRRTAASHMASLGITRLVIAKLLNHADGSVTAVYERHSYDREKREAITLWHAYLARLGCTL